MTVTPEHAAEYRAVTDAHDTRGKDFVRAAWHAGHKFMEYGDTPPEIAVIVGHTVEWVETRMDVARLSTAQLENLMNEKGINTIARIRREVIREGYAPPTGRDHPRITYMPPTLITALTGRGYSETALRNLMHRVGLALEDQMVKVAHVLDHPDQEFIIELKL